MLQKELLTRWNVTALIIYIVLAAIIWFGGPYIQIDNYVILQDRFARLSIIFLLAIIWGLIHFYHTHQKIKPVDVINTAENYALQNSFLKAVQFLNKRLTKSKVREGAIYTLPWFLVIGPCGSGKSTLLANSGIPFAEADKFTQLTPAHDQQSHSLNWWFTHSAVLVDVPGQYFDQPEDLLPTARSSWHEILRLLKTHRRLQPINGIIIPINIATLLSTDNAEHELLIQNLRSRLQETVLRLGCRIPVYIIGTCTDKIAGFNAYFDDLGANERTQAWGIFMQQKKRKIKPSELFNQEFDNLLKRLHERVLWRIHQERNITKRSLIKDFPQQLQLLKEPFAKIVYALTSLSQHDDTLLFRGVFFTSAVNHQGDQLDPLFNSVSRSFELAPLKYTPAPQMVYAYFVKQLLQDIIFPESTLATTLTKSFYPDNWNQLTAYGLAFIIVIMSSTYLSHRFSEQNAQLATAADAVTQYKLLTGAYNSNGPTLDQIIPALNALRIAETITEQMPTSFQLAWSLNKQNALTALTNHVYQNELQTRFMPAIQDILTNHLSDNANADPGYLYGALKTYLMLGDPTHRDNAFIKTWFHQHWTSLDIPDPSIQAALDNHLDSALTAALPALSVNLSVVNNIRNTLNAVPDATLAYAIIKNHFQTTLIMPLQTLSGKNDQTFQSMTISTQGIADLYSAKQIANIYQAINASAATLSAGNWILGKRSDASLSADNLARLQNAIYINYLNDYVNTWQSWLSSIKITHYNNLADASTGIQELIGKHSPLTQVLTVIANNTAPSAFNMDALTSDETGALQFTVISHFQPLNNVLTNPVASTISMKQINSTLQQLNDYIQNINNASDSDAAAFDAAKTRMSGSTNDPISLLLLEANQAPEPLKSWLNSMAINCWQLILNNAHSYLDAQWHTNVLSFYNSQINNRYPISNTATDNIDLADFTEFFRPDGTLDRYFNTDLAPFVDMSKVQWQWRTRDGLAINNTLDILDQFERSNIIQKMFFDKKGFLSVKFSLTMPIMDASLNSVTLNINGKKIENQAGGDFSHVTAFDWPGVNQINNVVLTFVSSQNQTFAAAENGPWAMFRILDKATLRSDKDMQHFDLIFNASGYIINYNLVAGNTINPFIPGIINQYRAPADI